MAGRGRGEDGLWAGWQRRPMACFQQQPRPGPHSLTFRILVPAALICIQPWHPLQRQQQRRLPPGRLGPRLGRKAPPPPPATAALLLLGLSLLLLSLLLLSLSPLLLSLLLLSLLRALLWALLLLSLLLLLSSTRTASPAAARAA